MNQEIASSDLVPDQRYKIERKSAKFRALGTFLRFGEYNFQETALFNLDRLTINGKNINIKYIPQPYPIITSIAYGYRFYQWKPLVNTGRQVYTGLSYSAPGRAAVPEHTLATIIEPFAGRYPTPEELYNNANNPTRYKRYNKRPEGGRRKTRRSRR